MDFDDTLKRLVGFRVDEGIHPFWHLAQDIDLRESVLARPVQRAFLARYGRQDYFAQRTLVEIESAVREISSLVRKEDELSRHTEER